MNNRHKPPIENGIDDDRPNESREESPLHSSSLNAETSEEAMLLKPNGSTFLETSLSVTAGQYNAIDGSDETTVGHDANGILNGEGCFQQEKEEWSSTKKKSPKDSTPITMEARGNDILKCNNLQTLMNLIKATSGTGILTLPYVFKDAGLWVGLICSLFVAVLAVHCMHIINNCTKILERKCKMDIFNFAQMAEFSVKCGPKNFQKFSNHARFTTIALIYGMHFGYVCIYSVWIATNVKPVVDVYWNDSPDVRVYNVMVFLCLLPMVMLKNLRTLAFFSALANLCYITGLIIIFQHIFRDIPDPSSRPAFGSWSGFPLFFATVVFAFESMAFVVPLRHKCKNRDDFGGWTGILTLGMVIITAAYCSTGFYGYLKYGDDIAPAITLNLPRNEWLYLSVNLIFALGLYISVTVQFYVPINIIWPALEPRIHRHKRVAEYCTRALLLTIIMLVGIVVPHIELLMSLVGSICGSPLTLILPAVSELLLLYEERDLTVFVIFKDVFLFVVGIATTVTGTYLSLVKIVSTF